MSGACVDAGVEEGAQKASVAEKDAEQLVVIDIDRVKACRVEKIVTVDKNGDPAPMSEFPGRAGSRLKHYVDLVKAGLCGFFGQAGSS